MNFDNKSLRTAVKLWLENQPNAIATYGHITHWNTQHVTDMRRMFSEAKTFNQQ